MGSFARKALEGFSSWENVKISSKGLNGFSISGKGRYEEYSGVRETGIREKTAQLWWGCGATSGGGSNLSNAPGQQENKWDCGITAALGSRSIHRKNRCEKLPALRSRLKPYEIKEIAPNIKNLFAREPAEHFLFAFRQYFAMVKVRVEGVVNQGCNALYQCQGRLLITNVA